MAFKVSESRRHHNLNQKYRVTKWAENDVGLRACVSLTVWFTPEPIDARNAKPRTGRGGKPTCCALAIVSSLALCQTEASIGSILQQHGFGLAMPDHSTLRRRHETLKFNVVAVPTRAVVRSGRKQSDVIELSIVL